MNIFERCTFSEAEVQEQVNFLFQPKAGEDSLFTHLRMSEYKKDVREYFAKLYILSKEWGGVDEHFLNDFHKSLVQRYWELHIGAWLVYLFPGKVRSLSVGPDYQITHESGRIFVECVAPMNFAGGPNIRNSRSGGGWINGDEPLLRLTGAIKEKADKAQRYIERGYITDDDMLVIAVSLAELPDVDLHETSEIPLVLRALLGLGKLVMKIPIFDGNGNPIPKEQQVVRSEPSYEGEIKTANGSVVDLRKFLTQDYTHVSAVFTSYDRYVENPENSHRFSLLHNPNARKQIATGIFGNLRHEYFCEDGKVQNFQAREADE
jgi:hypothetical protein